MQNGKINSNHLSPRRGTIVLAPGSRGVYPRGIKANCQRWLSPQTGNADTRGLAALCLNCRIEIAFDAETAGMNPTARGRKRARDSRRGLAPLELVLSLFFLLLVMALIINFGTIASWFVRGNVAARWAAWRTIGLRTGGNFPNPPNWQVNGATMGLAPAQPIRSSLINPVWNQGDMAQPAVRGQPLAAAIIDPATGNQFAMGNQQYMEMANTTQIGAASLMRTMPLLPKLPKANIQPLHPVVDPFWRFEDMAAKNVDSSGYPWSMRNNNDWRLFRWYLLEAWQLPGDVQSKYMLYQTADLAIQQNPGISALAPLDRDDEFMYCPIIQLRQVPPPDFYPRAGGCELNPQMVQLNVISGQNGLINRIEGPKGGGRGGVPDMMVRAFIQFYQQQLAYYQQQQPPDQAMIGPLQDKIQQLQKFQATLF
jgi:hypothetical protein